MEEEEQAKMKASKSEVGRCCTLHSPENSGGPRSLLAACCNLPKSEIGERREKLPFASTSRPHPRPLKGKGEMKGGD